MERAPGQNAVPVRWPRLVVLSGWMAEIDASQSTSLPDQMVHRGGCCAAPFWSASPTDDASFPACIFQFGLCPWFFFNWFYWFADAASLRFRLCMWRRSGNSYCLALSTWGRVFPSFFLCCERFSTVIGLLVVKIYINCKEVIKK